MSYDTPNRLMQSAPYQPDSSFLKAHWDGITVEYGQMNNVGEFDVVMPKHSVSVAFAPHDSVSWSVDGGSRQTTALPPGSAFLFSNREFVWHHRERASEYIHMMLAPQLLDQLATEYNLPTPIEIEYRVLFPDSTIFQVAQLLKSEIKSSGFAGKLYTESLRNLLAVHLLRNYSGAAVKPTFKNGPLDVVRLNQVKDFVEERLAQDLTIADMAAVVHMSQFHFARAFKAATGTPPHRYLTQRRIERAKVLLGVTRLSVAEVAHRLGFDNKSNFIAQFRKATGTTPKAFRDSSF